MPWPSEGTTNDQHYMKMYTDHGGFPIGYLLLAWPSARSPQCFINASNSYYLTVQSWVDKTCMYHTDLHSKLWPFPNQSDLTDRPIHGSVKDKLAIPQKPSEAYLTWHVIHAFNLRWQELRPPFSSAFSCSRKPSLFGLVDYQSHQAWVLVSTISRLTYMSGKIAFPFKSSHLLRHC